LHDIHKSSIQFHNTSDCAELAKKKKRNGLKEVTDVIYELQRCGDGKLRPVKGSADAKF
jgi:hypothetical protein